LLTPVRYPASFNDFAIDGDFEAYRQKLIQARDAFFGVYETVKDRVDASMRWVIDMIWLTAATVSRLY
jgi:hypothetical protein